MKKYSLPKEFATKWVAALRSGEYEQIKGDLFEPLIDGKKTECFCANGVGLLVFGIPRKELVFHSFVDRDLYNKYPSIPNDMVDEKATVGKWTLFDEVAFLNDTRNYTFPEIADWIEANVEFI